MQIIFGKKELRFEFAEGHVAVAYSYEGLMSLFFEQDGVRHRLGRIYIWGGDFKAKVDRRLELLIKGAKAHHEQVVKGELGKNAKSNPVHLAHRLAYLANLHWSSREWQKGYRRAWQARKRVIKQERAERAIKSGEGEHGLYNDGSCIHSKGCVPRAISRVFGKRLGMDYWQIVDACMKSKRAVGEPEHRLDFDSEGMCWEAQRHFAAEHGLRLIEFQGKPVPMKEAAKRYPDSVMGVHAHVLPFAGGLQRPNPGIYKRGSIRKVLVAA